IVREGNYQYNLHELLEQYGSPLEIVFPFIIERRLEIIHEAFRDAIKAERYRGKFSYHYPMKVNQNKEFVLPLLTEGANMETGSVNELRLIQKLWEQRQFSSQVKVLCNGPKTSTYLTLIGELKQSGLDIIPIVEDLDEFELLKGFRGQIGIRVNLDTKVHSHWDNKFDRFGITPQELLGLDRLKNFTILHYHLGSQMMHADDILNALKAAMALYVKLQAKHPHLDTIDVGGGFAVNYGKTKAYTARAIARRMVRLLRRTAEAAEVRPPNIIAEWGRAVVAPGQVTLYQVVAAKPIPKGNAKWWYIIDGSFMNDLLDTWAIHQRWHVVPIVHANAKRFTRAWLAGMSCDSDDKYTAGGDAVRLPRLEDFEPGERLSLAFFDTGAYQDALASHHCLLSSPAKIIAQNGEVKIIRPRETAEDVGKLFGW
ncbi:MAG: hypothetical protein Q7S02_01355, partial [bacterium]|nr:hypothetical protein [bacterium]